MAKCPKCGGVVIVITGSYDESAGLYCKNVRHLQLTGAALAHSCGWFGDREPYPSHQEQTAWWADYDRREAALLAEMPEYPSEVSDG